MVRSGFPNLEAKGHIDQHMMLKNYWLPLSIICFALLSGVGACKHEPFQSDDDITPIDTTGNNPVDTTGNNPVDTSGANGTCDTNVIYFQLQVLPILRSNCAISGCHDAITAEENIILDSYANVLATGGVKAGKPLDSEMYEKITEDKEDKRMPPAPRERLTSAQIKLIGDWISQGAKDLACEPATGNACNTDNVSFSMTVRPVIVNTCQGCHSGSAPSGGVNLSTYENIKAVAQSGRLLGAISWQSGFVQMPQGGSKLPPCTIDQIASWINAGAPNN